jgi:hypothetical protein
MLKDKVNKKNNLKNFIRLKITLKNNKVKIWYVNMMKGYEIIKRKKIPKIIQKNNNKKNDGRI